VAEHRITALLRAVGDVARLEADFGHQSIQALLWVASTIQAGVYVPGSLVRTSDGFRFALSNPPLRIGAFSSVRVLLDGRPVPPGAVRLRTQDGAPWRTAAEVSGTEPLVLETGRGSQYEVAVPGASGSRPITVRLEFQNVAIPPLVWLEFRETPREAGPT
jgi:hypothetical protein